MAPGDVVWLGRDKCALRLLELPRLPPRRGSGSALAPAPALAPALALAVALTLSRARALALAATLILTLTLTLSSGGLAEPSGKLTEASARLGGGGVLHRRSISDGQPTGGAGGGAAAAPAFRLSGTLHKKAQRSGIYQKRL